MESILWLFKTLVGLLNQFAAGILTGIAITFVGQVLVSRWNRPILKLPMADKGSLQGARIHLQCNMFPGLNPESREIAVWRLKICNRGRSAAKNVRATLASIDAGNKSDRRISWYEPPRNSLTLNRDDHSYLDLYGVVLGDNKICFPTETGWTEPTHVYMVACTWRFELRVTASNCKSLKKISFDIDPSQECKPIF